jgi:hypothetical protein
MNPMPKGRGLWLCSPRPSGSLHAHTGRSLGDYLANPAPVEPHDAPDQGVLGEQSAPATPAPGLGRIATRRGFPLKADAASIFLREPFTQRVPKRKAILPLEGGRLTAFPPTARQRFLPMAEARGIRAENW